MQGCGPGDLARVADLSSCCLLTLRQQTTPGQQGARLACSWCNQGLVFLSGHWETEQKRDGHA
jgi:hypothetical protein